MSHNVQNSPRTRTIKCRSAGDRSPRFGRAVASPALPDRDPGESTPHTATGYDQAGRVTTETVAPPNPADPPQTTTYTYDDAGRQSTHRWGTTVLATSTYDAAGELASVSYANGTALTTIGKDPAGRTTSLTWRTSDNLSITSTVTRTRAGTIIDETLAGTDARPNAPNYVYDTVGRLTDAWVTGHHYTYDCTSSAPTGCPTGTQTNAGTNTNRVRLLDQTTAGTAETGYCYAAADRVLATTGATTVSAISYDSHGNTHGWTQGAATTTLGWDGADRNTTIAVTGADPATVTYLRDATDRITGRNTTAGDTATSIRYASTAGGDAADLALDAALRLQTRTIALPGGVLYTIRGDGTATPTVDHPSVRGDLALTTDHTGHHTGPLRTYTPSGDPVTTAGTLDPRPHPGQPTRPDGLRLAGPTPRPHEHAGALSIIQMGARPYSPLLGRFLSVDPIDGGSANDYDHTAADPINTTDLDGQRARGPRTRNWRCHCGAPSGDSDSAKVAVRNGRLRLGICGVPRLSRRS
jgi:RHS repeat-associated protein